jgi:hypothetical protein
MLADVMRSERTNQIRELMKLRTEVGAEKLGGIAAKHGLAGAAFEARNQSVPGRDLMATLYADHHLRDILARSLGGRSPRTKADESRTTTVMENFLFLNTMTSRRGFADLYLLFRAGRPAGRRTYGTSIAGPWSRRCSRETTSG